LIAAITEVKDSDRCCGGSRGPSSGAWVRARSRRWQTVSGGRRRRAIGRRRLAPLLAGRRRGLAGTRQWALRLLARQHHGSRARRRSVPPVTLTSTDAQNDDAHVERVVLPSGTLARGCLAALAASGLLLRSRATFGRARVSVRPFRSFARALLETSSFPPSIGGPWRLAGKSEYEAG
jgi:hypothetical protein